MELEWKYVGWEGKRGDWDGGKRRKGNENEKNGIETTAPRVTDPCYGPDVAKLADTSLPTNVFIRFNREPISQ